MQSTGVVDRWRFEKALQARGFNSLAGVDEAGRGPLAGPVFAAATVLPASWVTHGMPAELIALTDSKQLSPNQRDRFFSLLSECPEVRWAIAQSSVELIDAINILQATHHAMNQALLQLQPPPDQALVDGLRVPSLVCPQTSVVHGDALSYSIAAASVMAKVTRDRLMLELDRQYPNYGFAEHKGYGTPQHLAALERHGPCPIHRRSFAPVRAHQLDLW